MVKLPLIVLRISAITITISTGDDLIGSSGSNVKLYGGTGNDTLMFWCTEANDTATSNYLDAGDGNNNINIYEYYQNDEFVRRIENMIVNAGSGYDSILVLSDKTTINAGGGSDKVWNVGKSNVINLGSGNDFAVNEYWSESYVAINGESGNDLLFNHGRYATINGGNDNDTIYNGGGNNSFLNGDAGNDVIVNGHNDPSSVEHYETYSEESEHVDVATLVADTSDRALVVSNVTLKGGKGNDTIAISSKSLMNVLQYASGDGNDIITNYSSHDTIQITNGLYSTQTSGNDVIIKIGSNSINLKNAKGTTLNIAGTTSDKVSVASDAVTYNGHSYKLYTLGKTWDEAKTYCENLGGHLVAINNSDEQSIIEGMISDGSKGSYWLGGYKNGAGNWNWITNEPFYYNNWAYGEPNNADGQEDKIMMFKIPDTPKNPASKFGDWNDITADCGEGEYPENVYGINSFGFICEWDTISSSNSSSDTVTSNSVTLTNSDSSSYTATSIVKIIDASSRTKNVKITGNSLSNSIVSGSGADSLSGGNGADTLNGGTSNDTLTGGDGADVFVYTSGKDIITDYEEGVDRVVISDGYVSASSVKGSDVVLKVGKDTITLKKAKDKEITVTDELGEHTRVYGNDMFITDSDKAKIKAKSKIITIDATARTTAINITGSSKANTILGGSGKNTINGGSGNDYLVGGDDNDKLLGGAGADTLIGSAGNDTLTGGASKDVFIYESGNDIITDYKASQKDEIVLTNGTLGPVSVKGSNVIFTIGDGQLTVKGGKSQTITITDADGNKTSQKYTKSSSYEEHNFVEDDYWFAEDNNFATTDMDSIVKVDSADYSVGKMYTSDELTELAQNTQTSTEMTYTKDNK